MAITKLNDPNDTQDPAEKAKEQFQNLVKQLPAEATGIYLAGLSFFSDSMGLLTVAAFVGFAMLVWVRRRANVTPIIWSTSIIGYLIWVYTIGNSPIQAGLQAIGVTPHPNIGNFLVVIYSTIVGYLAINPPKQETRS